jgi:hypothetical protein
LSTRICRRRSDNEGKTIGPFSSAHSFVLFGYSSWGFGPVFVVVMQDFEGVAVEDEDDLTLILRL